MWIETTEQAVTRRQVDWTIAVSLCKADALAHQLFQVGRCGSRRPTQATKRCIEIITDDKQNIRLARLNCTHLESPSRQPESQALRTSKDVLFYKYRSGCIAIASNTEQQKKDIPGKLPQVVKKLPTEYDKWYEIVSRQIDKVILPSFGCKVHGFKWAQ